MTTQTIEHRKHTLGRNIAGTDYRIEYEVRLAYDEWNEYHGDRTRPPEHHKELSEVEVVEMRLTPSTDDAAIIDKAEALVLEHEWEEPT